MLDDEPIPIAPARGWLLSKGWRKHGLIRFDETPGAAHELDER